MARQFETKEVKIVKEKDQFAIRIPKGMEEIFDIDTQRDKFLWEVHEIEEELVLTATLLKEKNNEKENI